MRSFFKNREHSDSRPSPSFIRKPGENSFIHNSLSPSEDSFIPPIASLTTNTLEAGEETETLQQNVQRKCKGCEEGSESVLTSGTSTMEEQETEGISKRTSTMEEEEAAQTISSSTSTMEEQESEAISGGTSTVEEEEAQTLSSTSTMEEEEAQTLSSTSTMEEQETESLASGTSTIENEETETIAGHCSVQSGNFTSIPSGTVAASYSAARGKYGAPFRMRGNFGVNPPCSCSNGEYRQYVRGYFKKNGRTVTHRLCGTNLSTTTYQEDCGISGGRTYRYGYRNNQFGNSYFTSPDQTTGCAFVGYDYPGIRAASGDRVEIKLEFIGRLVDTSRSNHILSSSSWTVEGTSTIP